PYYTQHAASTARGLREHASCLEPAGKENQDADPSREAAEVGQWATELRGDIERSLKKSLADRSPAMKEAEISPFTAFDTSRKPGELSSYEHHRYMMDWW